MEGRDSDVRHEGRQRSHAEESVNTDNDDDHNHSINSRKRRAMDGRLDTVMEIDLSVNLDEEKDDLSESEIIRKKPTSNLIHSSDQVQRDVEKEEEGEPMEAYEGIHDHEKPSLKASASVSDSELVDKSKLESLHIEVDKMREENQKLKSALSDTMNNYQSLQMHLQRVMQQGQQQENYAQPEATPKESKNWEEESKLVSLSLGINPSSTKATKEETAGGNNGKEVLQIFGRDRRGSQDHLKGFSLSLDVNDQETSVETNEGNLSSARSPTKSDGGLTKSETADLGPESGSRLKIGVVNHCQEGFLQSNKAIKDSHDADENSEAATRIRKARVSVRARCEAPTMIDGCHWRKYGQKIAKGNPCPRAYYRCTVVPGCPVRKQVQRCPDDMAILISTYEGSHNHPLPIAATAMASTTEAAVSMLLSGSSSSLEAMNANNPYMSRLDQSFAFNPTISTSAPFPTITLDLTDNPTSQLNPRSSVAAGGSLSTSFASTFPLSFRYPSAGHNVLSTPHHPNTILSSKHSFAAVSGSNPWNSNHFYYAQPPHQQAYSRPNSSIQTENHDRDRQMFHSQHQTSVDSFLNNPAARAIQGALSRYSCQTLIQNVMSETYKRSTVTTGSASSAQHSLADTVTAATAAITSDPNFTTALVNAVASIISSQGTQSNGGGPNCDQKKWGEPITDLPDLTASYPPQSNTLFSATS